MIVFGSTLNGVVFTILSSVILTQATSIIEPFKAFKVI
ncbi:hypothetical protein FLB_25230 [Flavobacterium succinicans]|uniref:Uncharacterized protein n=1 Tax=Flavobacterium succinicans TaxID=29536 RepID=A0A199XPE1_9FLAO|nr:hypothetical protein FLB_25230 [Flavobacterium succinicans]